MKALGLVSEWHPFHHGHAYFLKEARRASQADILVAVMSGNFTQRGEPAILDKWARAEVAIDFGCDLVFELPVWWATQPANRFAWGSVSLLHQLGVQGLAFGTEAATFTSYIQFARWLSQHQAFVNKAWRAWQKGRPYQSYAEARFAFYQELCQQEADLAGLELDFAQKSNNLLAFRYVLAAEEQGLAWPYYPIPRFKASHRTQGGRDGFASGSWLRKEIRQAAPWSTLAPYVPKKTLHQLKTQNTGASLKKAYPYLRYVLLSQTPRELAQTYLFEGGIAYRLQEKAQAETSYEAFIQAVRNKNWPKSRLERTLLQLFLQRKDRDMRQLEQEKPPFLLLGASPRGRKYLRQRQALPVISRWQRSESERWPAVVQAERLYEEFLAPRATSQLVGRIPYFSKAEKSET